MKKCRLFFTFLMTLFFLFPSHISLMDFGPEYSDLLTSEFCFGLSSLLEYVEKTDKNMVSIRKIMANLLQLISIDGLNPNASLRLEMPCLSYVFNYIQFRSFRKIARALFNRWDLDPNAQDSFGTTPLMHLIVSTADFQDTLWLVPFVQEFFALKKFNINVQNSDGESALNICLQPPCNYIIGHMILNNKDLIIMKKDYALAQQQLELAKEQLLDQLKLAQKKKKAEEKQKKKAEKGKKKKTEKKKKKKNQTIKPQPTFSMFKPENYAKNAEFCELVIKKYEDDQKLKEEAEKLEEKPKKSKEKPKKKKPTKRKKKSQEPKK